MPSSSPLVTMPVKITLLCCLFALLGTRVADAQVQQHDFQSDVAVDRHNELRALVGASNMNKLSWDQALAEETATFARQCRFEHDQDSSDGENIYFSSGTFSESTTLSAAIQAWYDEMENYDYEIGACAEGKVCGHYTQVVWSSSDRIGCAAVSCSSVSGLDDNPSGILVFCRYKPAGNNPAVKPFEKGDACSSCDPKHSFCDEGLCSETSPDPTTTTADATNSSQSTSAKPTSETTTTKPTTTLTPTTEVLTMITSSSSTTISPPTTTTTIEVTQPASATPTTAKTEPLTSVSQSTSTMPSSTSTMPSSTTDDSTTLDPTTTTMGSPTTSTAPPTTTTDAGPATPAPEPGSCSSEYLAAVNEYKELLAEYRESFDAWKNSVNL